MEKEFDFKQVGKRMPYKTPPGFLDELEDNVWSEVQNDLIQRRKHKAYRLRIIIAGAMAVAASIVLLVVFSPLANEDRTDTFSRVEQAFANLSQEDQAYMLAVYYEDIFMNE